MPKSSPFKREIEQLRPQMVEAAQKIYDEWEQDENGEDPELGSGGICDQIADAIVGVLQEHLGDIDTFEGGQDGDDHAWVIVQRGSEAYGVDIPPGVYESGGGYSWKKIDGVVFKPEYIVIFPVDPQENED